MISLPLGIHGSLVERTSRQILVLLAAEVASHLPSEIGQLMARERVVENLEET